jgi:hypothetical protein
MPAKTSKSLPLLCVLLALAIGLAGWSALSGSDEAGPAALEDANHAAAPTPQAPSSPTIAALPKAERDSPRPEPAGIAGATERVSVATNDELELAAGLWVSGRVVFPEGTPIGENVEVIGRGKEFKTRALHRARVDANGNFRLAFAPNTRSARIELDAPHLYLSEMFSFRFKDGRADGEILLEPALGGRLIVSLQVPSEAAQLAAELVGKSASSWGWHETTYENCQRTAIVDANLQFELRGLTAGMTHHLNFASQVVAPASLEASAVEAGQTQHVDMPLRAGVRLSGRVQTAGGAVQRGLILQAFSTREDSSVQRDQLWAFSGEVGESQDVLQVAEDGRFEARGVAAGHVSLKAQAPQRLPATLQLGQLADGDVREGLELTLELGGQIGGHVRWPDNTPVAGASLQLEYSQARARDRSRRRSARGAPPAKSSRGSLCCTAWRRSVTWSTSRAA